jgi:16S rRNA (adenine1518-N6/adenine1519-N6)-dimethyltransferase
MTEYMDIVNEDDEVIGRDTRARVHAGHHIHRGVHVFVVNRAGDLLLQRRADSKSYYPGHWDSSVGGQVAAGESYEEAAARELTEELGCPPGPIRFVARYDAFSNRQREKRALFEHRCDGPFRADAEEIAEIRFVPVARVASLVESEPFTEGFRRSFSIWTDWDGARA